MRDPLETLGSLVSMTTESGMKEDLCVEIDPPLTESVDITEYWSCAMEKVVPAIVVLRTTACGAFDTESAGGSYASGFIVDKRRGIILTHRYVVKPGSVVTAAMFVNREEIRIYPVYMDPVHDFGFFSYDPGAVQFLSYEEIPLAPEAASVGLQILVFGNDSGEMVSIMSGTLARLDRDAPHYKKDDYNDFSMFYMQAASGTLRGSSGSPVIDCQGRAVALSAGSESSSASAFFLPLQRVVRALSFLQKSIDSYTDKPKAFYVPRGTLQMTFVHKGFDEIRRLGLRSETEQVVRLESPTGETGMLVVYSVVPSGPADKLLEPGDVLVRVNGKVLTQFLNLENLLDDGIGQILELEIERGGRQLSVGVSVQDLHSITPDHILEVSDAVIHYQQDSPSVHYCNDLCPMEAHDDYITDPYLGLEIQEIEETGYGARETILDVTLSSSLSNVAAKAEDNEVTGIQQQLSKAPSSTTCRCTKNKCLNLYCKCFASGGLCIACCWCQQCKNNPNHEDVRREARQKIEARNPYAFGKKKKKGCNCKKTNCLKKYCECFLVGCSSRCRCVGCKNPSGQR